MARFTIYSPNGTALYEGAPVFNGTYMKPSSLTFRKISSPVPINWEYGCYIEYNRFNDMTEGYDAPMMYFLFELPQVKKRARARTNGFSFEYENVVFYDKSKLLDYCPFRDLVTADNQVHFSSRPTFSTYEAVDGIARRIEACLQAQYPDDVISVVVATTAMGASQDLVDLMAEPREFSVDLVTCMGALDQIYQVWPNVGWVFQYNWENDYMRIVIGGAGLIGTQQNWCYGKGWGLKEITRTLGNNNEIMNRIYPFGNTTNMPGRYYNGFTSIANHDSVDIPNLMPPVADWGKDADQKAVPAKAYYEDATSIARIGLRPKRVYFDGNNDLDDIYPTIKGMTTGDVRERHEDYEDVDYPVPFGYPDTDLNTILTVIPDVSDTDVTTFDGGITGEDGKVAVMSTQFIANASSTVTDVSSVIVYNVVLVRTITLSQQGNLYLNFQSSDFSAGISTTRNDFVNINIADLILVAEYTDSGGNSRRVLTRIPLVHDFSIIPLYGVQNHLIKRGLNDVLFLKDVASNIGISFALEIRCDFDNPAAYNDYDIFAQGTIATKCLKDLKTDFAVTVPPFGYDIMNIPSDGDRIMRMTSGKCGGREFVIKGCSFNSDNELILTLDRVYDESLAQYFPNYDYPIEADDTFVFLGIQMPDMYITAAADRLKVAAQTYLDEYKKEIWQYNPTIDDKYMLEQERVILPAQNMIIIDPEIIEGDTLVSADPNGYVYFDASDGKFYLADSDGGRILLPGAGFAETVLVDSVSVDEAAVIPAWKVTLRDRKKQKRN